LIPRGLKSLEGSDGAVKVREWRLKPRNGNLSVRVSAHSRKAGAGDGDRTGAGENVRMPKRQTGSVDPALAAR
jgi:hypothetical protein